VHISPTFCIGALAVFGATWLRVACFRTMGRLFTFQMSIKDEHKLVTDGPYSIVRHPSYTALLLLTFGLTCCELSSGMYWTALGLYQFIPAKILCCAWIWTVIWMCMITGRAWKEDAFLKKEFGAQWEDYASRVPFMFVPGL
ncbi:hypothetical protein K488DRAFT_15681, partial [Vararia minispora EC-137]